MSLLLFRLIVLNKPYSLLKSQLCGQYKSGLLVIREFQHAKFIIFSAEEGWKHGWKSNFE